MLIRATPTRPMRRQGRIMAAVAALRPSIAITPRSAHRAWHYRSSRDQEQTGRNRAHHCSGRRPFSPHCARRVGRRTGPAGDQGPTNTRALQPCWPDTERHTRRSLEGRAVARADRRARSPRRGHETEATPSPSATAAPDPHQVSARGAHGIHEPPANRGTTRSRTRAVARDTGTTRGREGRRAPTGSRRLGEGCRGRAHRRTPPRQPPRRHLVGVP